MRVEGECLSRLVRIEGKFFSLHTTPESSKGLPKVNSPCMAAVFKRQLRPNERFKNDAPLSALWRAHRDKVENGTSQSTSGTSIKLSYIGIPDVGNEHGGVGIEGECFRIDRVAHNLPNHHVDIISPSSPNDSDEA